MIELGGNIKLSGFRELDSGSMIILKKIIGSYARKMSNKSSKFESLELTLKKIQDTKENFKFKIHSKLIDNGLIQSSEATEKNIFFGIDLVLKKTLNE